MGFSCILMLERQLDIVMNLQELVRSRGGVDRSSWLRERGVTEKQLTSAARSGQVIRPRRGWVALPDADAELIAAARHGVVLTCVTQARRRGLWVLKEDRPHVAAPSHSGSMTAKNGVVHWRRPLVPRPPGTLEDPIENLLVNVALCQPVEAARAVWESALRQQFVTMDSLALLPLPGVAHQLLATCSIWSDSGLETFVVPRLRWMRLPLRQQTWVLGHRVDLLIGERLILQIDGAHHVGPQRDADIAHDAHLRLAGYFVIRVSYAQVLHYWAEVQDLLMRAVAQQLHVAR